MYFPAGIPDALDIVRKYDGGVVRRIDAEAALDFYIMCEPDVFGRGGADMKRFRSEDIKAKRILRRYAEQMLPCNLETLQAEFYTFSNSTKYRYTADTISVVRTMLSTAWEGLAGWRD